MASRPHGYSFRAADRLQENDYRSDMKPRVDEIYSLSFFCSQTSEENGTFTDFSSYYRDEDRHGKANNIAMKIFHLHFFEPWPERRPEYIESMSMEGLEQPGAYVIGTHDGTVMQYPWGTSPIFYIGKSESLKSRLVEHRGYIRSADTGTRQYDRPWWPRYQYSVAFGADVAVYLPSSGHDADSLERDILNDFYELYGSIPVANAAWPSRMRTPEGG